MVDLERGKVDGLGGKALAFFSYRLTGGDDGYAAPLPMMERHAVYEPRKTYTDSDNRGSAAASETSAHGEDIFTRLARLRAKARGNSVKDQLERLQGIAQLMQAAEQGPLPGEMLKVYGWEVEDAVEKLRCSLFVSRSSKKK